MRNIQFTQEAIEELEQAAVWYEEECTGLGQRFIEATESALALLKDELPLLVPAYGEAGKKGVKQILLNRFPFSLIVLPRNDEMIIVAVAHQHRKPLYWSGRA